MFCWFGCNASTILLQFYFTLFDYLPWPLSFGFCLFTYNLHLLYSQRFFFRIDHEHTSVLAVFLLSGIFLFAKANSIAFFLFKCTSLLHFKYFILFWVAVIRPDVFFVCFFQNNLFLIFITFFLYHKISLFPSIFFAQQILSLWGSSISSFVFRYLTNTKITLPWQLFFLKFICQHRFEDFLTCFLYFYFITILASI